MLHQINWATAHSMTGLFAAGIIVLWVVVGVTIGFPSWWEYVLYVVSSTITLLILSAIQHTQGRQQAALHRKLDEVLRALPHTDERLIAVEEASDADPDALATRGLSARDDAVEQHGHLHQDP